MLCAFRLIFTLVDNLIHTFSAISAAQHGRSRPKEAALAEGYVLNFSNFKLAKYLNRGPYEGVHGSFDVLPYQHPSGCFLVPQNVNDGCHVISIRHSKLVFRVPSSSSSVEEHLKSCEMHFRFEPSI